MASTELFGDGPLEFEGFTIDPLRRGLYRGEERIHLTLIPLKVLTFLIQKRGVVVSKRDLLDAVWGGQRHENTVEQTIRQIRRALGDEKEQPRFIRTIPGVGYSFIADIESDDVAQLDQLPATGPQSVDPSASRGRSQSLLIYGMMVPASVIVTIGLLFGILTLRQTTPGLTVENPMKVTRSHSSILSPLLGGGARIYYPRYENGSYNVAVVPTTGGESSIAATGIKNPELCDLARDGKTMLLRDLLHSRDELEPLFIQPNDGPVQRVGNVLAYDAGWYPDAKRILFSADGVVYATDIHDRSRQRLFSVPGNAFWFRWSPNGKYLRFTVIDKANEETSIWQVSTVGKEPRRLLPDFHKQVCCGSWTPDGRYFLFQVRVGDTFQVWAQRNQTSFLLHLLPFRNRPFPLVYGAMSYRSPLASKDGRRLFLRAEAPRGEIVQYDSKAGQFISILPSISARTLAFSKDRNWVAYTSLADNQLWRCRADGTECIQLTQGFKNTVMPRWSPNGQTIAFMAIGFTGRWKVYAVPANGGTSHPLSSGFQAKGYPDWSPDGRRLVFSDVPPVSQAQGIYILDLHSNRVTTLANSAGYSCPRWSPDGRSLVALHSGDLHLQIYDFAEGKWRPLGDIPAAYPNWSHDGKYVYFRRYTSGSPSIFRVAVLNQVEEKVTDLSDVERGPFFMGDWIGLGSGDAPIAIRNSTIGDIYAWDLVAR